MDRLTDFIERLYKGVATVEDMTQAKRLTIVRDDPKCICGHKAWDHKSGGYKEPSNCHKYGCSCTKFERA